MYTALRIKPAVYWLGAIDWNARNFHGYITEDGITYNAYLIMDEKITLIDTAKKTFTDEFLQRISSIVDPSKIDILIANHVEMDHSGNIATIKALSPNVEIYASQPAGVKGLTAHYGDLGYHGVKTGDTLSIGRRTLQFIQTPMVHWPDNMVTLDIEDHILFSNDAFGQHFASSARFDDENDISEVMKQARKYYANIVLPYRAQAQKALQAIRALGDKVEMIAPAHGVIWRSYLSNILDEYEHVFTSPNKANRAVIVYDSMWGSTDKMAHAICEAFIAEHIEAHLYDLKATHPSDIMTTLLDAKYICVGSPTLNSQMLASVAGFLTYMKGLSPKALNGNRVGVAFGSYGWAPLGPKAVQAELQAAGFTMPLPVVSCNWIPKENYLDGICRQIRALIAR